MHFNENMPVFVKALLYSALALNNSFDKNVFVEKVFQILSYNEIS